MINMADAVLDSAHSAQTANIVLSILMVPKGEISLRDSHGIELQQKTCQWKKLSLNQAVVNNRHRVRTIHVKKPDTFWVNES